MMEVEADVTARMGKDCLFYAITTTIDAIDAPTTV